MYEVVKDFLSWLQGRSDRRGELVTKALLAMQSAIIETKKYEEERDAKGLRDRAKEYVLAELWGKAAVEMRLANNDLALRLNDKARYWSAQISWTEDEIVEKRIKLVSLEDEVNRLLNPDY